MTPSIGRIVHYYQPEQGPLLRTLPAIICDVSGPDTVTLEVFGGSIHGYVVTADRTDEPKAKHWSWPPRV